MVTFPILIQVQQFKCNICFPHIVFHALIEKKTKGKKEALHTMPFLGQVP
jgi:hypothetical protein